MKILKLIKFISAISVLSVLISCSATDGSGTEIQTANSGRVSLLITDGPTLDFDRINITLESISFIGEADGHETIVFDESRVVNLLALQNYSDLLTTTMIPAGIYSKIRLHVSQVELVKLNPDGTVLSSDLAKLPANGKIDLNPQGSFEVIGNGHLVIEFDMDAEKSIHIVETGNGKYNFRPVIFVNILGEEELKLVILNGKVLERTETGFQLCALEVSVVNENCMAVHVSADTVIQDDMIELVVPPAGVEDDDVVTVLGKAGSENVNALHVVIAADEGEPQNQALFTGNATSAVDVDNEFGMLTDDNNAVVPPQTALTVVLGDGARIFDKHGTEAASDVINDTSAVDVFGLALPDLGSVANVKAAFLIYDNKVAADTFSGTIAAINGTDSEITVTVVSTAFTGDVCADVETADMFLLDIVESKINSDEISIADLKIGMTVDVYGQDEGLSCFSADVVLASEN